MASEEINSIFEKEHITTEITCSRAFAISDQYGISRAEISRYCKEKKIKIKACQLGCF